MIDTDFLKHLDRLSLIINKRVTSNYVGERPSIHAGHGTVFKDHGIYTPGDDFRRIDWKVFARTDKLHIRRYEEEKSLVVHVLIDSSASMNYGSEANTKFDYASMIGIGFAYMAMKKNEKFVLSTFSDRFELFMPKRGKRQLVATLHYLKDKKAEGVSKFEEALSGYSKCIKHKSLIVIISDFLYDPEDVKRALFRFKNHEIKLVQILDPLEVKLNLRGEFKLKDMETKGFLRTFISPFLKRDYMEKLAEHVNKLRWIANGVNATFHSLSTDTPVYDTFYKILRD